MPWLYILQCADGSYYVGSTTDLERRISAHSVGQGATYTARRRPVTLVYDAEFGSIAEAYAAEKQVQGWGRDKREALIRGDFEALSTLARKRFPPGRQGDITVRPAPATPVECAELAKACIETQERTRQWIVIDPPGFIRNARHERYRSEGHSSVGPRGHTGSSPTTPIGVDPLGFDTNLAALDSLNRRWSGTPCCHAQAVFTVGQGEVHGPTNTSDAVGHSAGADLNRADGARHVSRSNASDAG